MIRTFQILFFSLLFSISATAQFVNFEDTWQEFLRKEKVAGISKLPKPSKEDKIDYCKFCLMYATTDFCGGNIRGAENYMAEIRKIGIPVYEKIIGFKAKYDDLDTKINASQRVGTMWLNFIEHYNVSLADLEKAGDAKRVCEKGTLAKYFHMKAYASYCDGDLVATKDNFQNRVLKLTEKTSLKVEDVPGLKHEVAQMKGLFASLDKLSPAWKKFTMTGESVGFDTEIPLFKCNAVPNMMAWILRGASDICGRGEEALAEIKKLKAGGGASPTKEVNAKINWLKEKVGEKEAEVDKLNAAWEEFLSNGKLEGEIKFGYEYCNKEDEIRAYTLTGILDVCGKGKQMLEKVIAIQKEEELEVEEFTLNGIKMLGALLQKKQGTVGDLDTAWSEFIESGDTLTNEYKLLDKYCNNISLIKSWTIRGHLEACAKGQQYFDKIENLKATESLEFDEELICRVERLRTKIWDCRYWELVEQARKETHQERETFGPKSADIMRSDLNGDELPCETTVEYNPLGYIGIKYVITAFLCQNVDLAKMGDPEYYKKIATWVDTEVLQKYCTESGKCKDDFFIYLEGHTDGNAFRGARYKNSLGIPEGTEFTHFDDDEGIETVTDREITTSLKSNMELGIARAWTVKNQLDFMEVPIKIGAYEHPASEKGGEYRRIEIELNITKLMLDFYEKRLGELLEASGIGERPVVCE